ncbi:hypothetical protein OHA77_38625 [Streptosporangium sp. NBC_01639]|nr:hypothetical protein OHA77_38625 [Streptosporangium sp. NBC_01639]
MPMLGTFLPENPLEVPGEVVHGGSSGRMYEDSAQVAAGLDQFDGIGDPFHRKRFMSRTELTGCQHLPQFGTALSDQFRILATDRSDGEPDHRLEVSEETLARTLANETRAHEGDLTAYLAAGHLLTVYRVLFADVLRRILAGEENESIRTHVAEPARRGFDLLQPVLGDYAVRRAGTPVSGN